MMIGYARVSTPDQQLHLQIDALLAHGCAEVVQEKVSSAKELPAQQQQLGDLRKGDTLVLWKLDRLGRSLKVLVALVAFLEKKGVLFVSLQDKLDTTTAQGRLMFNLFASLAEFERDLTRERTKAGLAAARARRRQGGRPKGLTKAALAKAAKVLYQQQEKTVAEIGQVLGVGRATINRYQAHLGVATGKA
ncbi:recombinase family protein [Hymenobacter wooponensis]|uniref:Recombinase family protein n=1 Tax=Hymenobacter wooponensis TaxID=1525360 RepID=A0A4Z0MMH0_9BACT|nr:recombinase family protein [Hymenobacter wooponensis]TGD80824.1 recombinase family protein [Hymenobacter wooponensis]